MCIPHAYIVIGTHSFPQIPSLQIVAQRGNMLPDIYSRTNIYKNGIVFFLGCESFLGLVLCYPFWDYYIFGLAC